MSETSKNLKEYWQRIFYFFPFQLFAIHFKRHLILVIIWAFLCSVISGYLGKGFGLQYLFLSPEYLGSTSFSSHLILGFSMGALIMAFNISSYILNAENFAFIATLSRPFLKYCFNNFIIPIGVLIYYTICMLNFHQNNLLSTQQVFINLTGFILGNVIFIVLSLIYFFSTNRSVFEILKLTAKDKPQRRTQNFVRGFLHRFDNLTKRNFHNSIHIKTYLAHPFKIVLARESEHYEAETLRLVFSQNHINASVFEFFVVLTVIALGIFRDFAFFQIPAGASILIMLSMFLMLFSALYSWLRSWSNLVIIAVLGLITYRSTDNLNSLNKAYGINYNHKTAYTIDALHALENDSIQKHKDLNNHIDILNAWKKKHESINNNSKPKLVFINSSGGGLRSALWSYHMLAHLDSIFNHKFIDKVHLMSGSSGGMLGAAYARGLHQKRKERKNIHLTSKRYYDNISRDLLNPIVFTIAVHDLYFNFSREINNNEILKDRAYAFEKQFNKNTDYVLHKTLGEYAKAEYKSEIPLMILSPTILNDNRKLMISAQGISFISNKNSIHDGTQNNYSIDKIEFSRLFKTQNPNDLSFVSALRMNATFPYILPNVSLPTEPTIQVFDAGARDNFGLETSIDYISKLKGWIQENTSGVLIIQLRDVYKTSDANQDSIPANFEENPTNLTPLGNVMAYHNYNQDFLFSQFIESVDFDVQIVNLELENPKDDRIALSWHLTNKEKHRILTSHKSLKNQQSIQKIAELLE